MPSSIELTQELVRFNTINPPGAVETPTISPSTNIYTIPQTVSITCGLSILVPMARCPSLTMVVDTRVSP